MEYLIVKTVTEYEGDVTRNDDGVPIRATLDVVDRFDNKDDAWFYVSDKDNHTVVVNRND